VSPEFFLPCLAQLLSKILKSAQKHLEGAMSQHLKEEHYYNDFYDLLTIEECAEASENYQKKFRGLKLAPDERGHSLQAWLFIRPVKRL